jgi:hypothetical protein
MADRIDDPMRPFVLVVRLGETLPIALQTPTRGEHVALQRVLTGAS